MEFKLNIPEYEMSPLNKLMGFCFAITGGMCAASLIISTGWYSSYESMVITFVFAVACLIGVKLTSSKNKLAVKQ